MNQVPIQGKSAWDKGLESSASCGKFVGISGGVVCVILIIILCGIGIFLYTKKTTVVYNKVSATILDAKCSQVIRDDGRNRNVSYNCEIKVKYNINGEEYQNMVTSNDYIHNVGEIRDIYYNVANPNDIKYSYIENKFIGNILIGIGSCFVVLLVIHIVLTMKSEWYNRLQCIGAISKAIRM